MMEQHTGDSLRESVIHFWELSRKYKKQLFLLLGVVLVIESLYVAEKYLFKFIIDDGTSYAAGTLSRNAFIQGLIIIAFVFAGLIILRAIMKWTHITLINRLDATLIKDMKRKFFDHIISLSYNFHTTHKTGSLISRLTRGGRAIESMMDVVVFNTAPMIFQLVVASIAIFTISSSAALTIVITVIAFISFSIWLQQRQYPYRVIANDTEDFEKANIGDIFLNIDSIKYFGKEERIKARYEQLAEQTKKTMLRNWNFYRNIDAGQALILGVGSFAVIYFPLQEFLAGTITLGALVFVYTAYLGLISPMFGFVHGMRSFYQASADFESLYQYDKVKNEIVDKHDAKDLRIEKGSIEFRNMTFRYKARTLFKNFNLKIKPNEKVAIVGHSGSGKSTLVKILYRLYDVEEGQVLIDGNDIKEFKQESLRANLSIVPQECVLFDDTIYNNIAFSNTNADKTEVMRAIKFAQLDKIIANFPQKEDTIVGERGVRLSGGERQRVSIARAILANQKVLVLDEATSSLDSQTEHEIQRDLGRLMQGRTSIIIAHRLSTIMHADRIVVLENGQIVQQGTHLQLIKRKGPYKLLWDLQKGGYLDTNSEKPEQEDDDE